MYAIVEIAGHQYRVQEGDSLDVGKLEAEVQTSVDFDRVLFVGGEGLKAPRVGSPLLTGARVTGHVARHGLHRKQTILKRKRRGGRRVKGGHRQAYTCLKITKIEAGPLGESAHGH